MKSEVMLSSLKKRWVKSVSLLTLACALAAPVSPAQAQQTVVVAADPTATAINAVEHAYTVATDFIKEQEAEWGSSIAAANAYFQTQISTMLNDNTNTNARTTSNLNVLQTKAAGALDRSGKNACGTQQASSKKAAEKSNVNQMAAASAQANQNRPGTPAARAAELKNKCTLGFINTSNTTDPDSAMYKRLFGTCTTPASATAKAGSDRSISSLLDPLQYYVPDNFPDPMADGTYAPLSLPLKGCMGDCSPFAAAYTYCQNITPTMSVPSQATGNATVGDLSAGSRRDAQSVVSSIRACYKALWRRAAYPSSNPIKGHDQNGKTVTMHSLQAARCQDDFADKIITDPINAACQTNGRSDLQAEHDRAYRLGAQSAYETEVIPTVDLNTQALLEATSWSAEDRFQDGLVQEEHEVIEGITASHTAVAPSTSQLDQAAQ